MLTKEELPECPVATTVQLIGSKWKLLIIRNLLEPPFYGRGRTHYTNRLSGGSSPRRICIKRHRRVHASDPHRYADMGRKL